MPRSDDAFDVDDADTIDTTPADPFADPSGDDDDESSKEVMRRVLREQMATIQDDDEAFGPLDAPKEGRKLIAQDEGVDLIEKATRSTGRRGNAAPDGDGNDDDDAPVGGKSAAEGAQDRPPAASFVAGNIDLTGLDDERAAVVRQHVDVAAPVLALFKGQEKELEARNVTPAGVVQRLLDLNTYANENPAEYMAWVATQTNAAKPEELLEKAAALIGYKLVPEHHDPFEDDEAKALREENRRLKGFPNIKGPDDPARHAQRDLANFIAETDDKGQPLRPHFQTLRPQIVAAANALRQAEGGRAITTADLGKIYDSTVQRLGLQTPTPAAQKPAGVADKSPKNAATERALRASKSVDGSGQGADRRPALSEGSSVKDTLRHFIRGSSRS